MNIIDCHQISKEISEGNSFDTLRVSFGWDCFYKQSNVTGAK